MGWYQWSEVLQRCSQPLGGLGHQFFPSPYYGASFGTGGGYARRGATRRPWGATYRRLAWRCKQLVTVVHAGHVKPHPSTTTV